MGLNKKIFKTTVAGKPLIFEISSLAEQADAAVVCRYGETAVLATAVMGKEDRDIDFMPLVVDYEEKFYAAGKILGSRFIRREGRSSDEAVLSGRLIDRSIRPLFDHGIRRDIQVIITILAFDEENDPDFPALMATSLALAISPIPWQGPIGGVGISKINDELVINATSSQLKNGFRFDGFAAGPKDKINMIELEGIEAQENEVEEGLKRAQQEINKLIGFQNQIVEQIGKPKDKTAISFKPYENQELVNEVQSFIKDRLDPDKEKTAALRNELMEMLIEKGYEKADLASANHILEHSLDELVHKNIIEENKRPDGRKIDEIRELYSEVGLFKRNHGSALFKRGKTQSLAVTTLASPESAQTIESIEFSGKKRFMLHYNFPPYSTGEIGKIRGPSRREIGHGALAEKALKNMIPSKEEFPYAIRVVSEILSSNGSSSMASVCAASLSLMDAGVPIKKPVAGIAMGLMMQSDSNNKAMKYKILTDIQGPEDHHGDMDFKVAGTNDGITAIQLDVKIDGLTVDIIKQTLAEAKKARLQILEHMKNTIAEPRQHISPYAPHILTLRVAPDKIGLIIGPGGKTINSVIKKYQVEAIDIDEDGLVYISANSYEKAENAKKELELITRDYHEGDIIEGKVVKIMDFGAIVELGPYQDGMIHISELSDKYVKNVRDVVKEGDVVKVKVIKVDGDRISLSLKGVPK